ncbi:hypothetical protein Kisp02_43190 [Kineosporia sp. NBRC 101731]|nr:hypothetical protein Kisp02_43190 [Kineosporia sp. NBRC 101731]
MARIVDLSHGTGTAGHPAPARPGPRRTGGSPENQSGRSTHGGWRLLFPAALVAQRVYRRRYARALREPLAGGR